MNTLESNVCPCGAHFPRPTNGCGAAGYVIRKDGTMICYDCEHKLELEALKDRSHPFFAYVGANKNANLITTWTGHKLMTITSSRPCRLTRFSYRHSRRSFCSIHAVDVHGGHWAGRGSAGIAIKLRPVKG